MLEIKEVQENALGAFVDFPYGLFRGHPYWVGELKKDVGRLLGSGHPFWRHAERRLFMAFRDGRPAGRLAAVINHKHNSFHDEKCGFFGFFDCVEDAGVSNAMFEAALGWLKAGGMDKVRGPVNPSTNETCGLLIDGFDSPPVIMMPYNPPYYEGLIGGAGFAKAKDLYAFRCAIGGPFPERLERIVRRITSGGKIRIEMVDTGHIDRALADLKDIYNAAWEKNWGFVPMTNEEIDEMAAALRPLLKPDYLFFVKLDGKPAGFSLLLPDFNIPLKAANGSLNPLTVLPFLYRMLFRINSCRLLALGVRKEFRNRGLELLLIKRSKEAAVKMKWAWSELSWTLEDNDRINGIIGEIGGTVYKKYRIYEKPL